MVSRKKYMTRLIGGSALFFLFSALISAFFFSLGRGHSLNFNDPVPWVGAAIISTILTTIWAKRNAKSFRERRNLFGPDRP